MTEPGRTAAPATRGLRGRDSELARIHAAVSGRAPAVVWISGMPGSGRSELLRRAPVDESTAILVRAARSERAVRLSAAELIVPDIRECPDPFAALVARLREDRVEILLVDDADWCDEASWQTVRAAAAATGVPIVATVLSASPLIGADDVEVAAGELDDDAAAALISDAAPDLSPAAANRMIAAGEGNPLALRELIGRGPSDLDDPSTPLLEASYDALIDGLPEREALVARLIAVGDWRGAGVAVDVLSRCCPPDDIASLTRAGLATSGDGRLRLRHGALRRRVESGILSPQRRRIAQQLAAVTGDERDALWFRSEQTDADDPLLADGLERAAVGILPTDPTTAARMLARAAAVHATPDGRRWILAAEARMDAQQGYAVPALLRRARMSALDPEWSARSELVEGVLELGIGNPEVARQHLLAALTLFPPGHAKRSRAISIAAEIALWFARRDWVDELTEAIDPAEPGASLVATVHAYLHTGAPPPAAALPRGEVGDQLVSAGIAALVKLDERSAAQVADALATSAPQALTAHVLRSLSAWHGATDSSPSTDAGAPWEVALTLAAAAHHAADRGDGESCRTLAAEAIRLAVLAEFPLAGASAQWASARALLQDGEPAAVAALLESVVRPGSELHHPVIAALAGPDLLEALARSGDLVRFTAVRELLPRGFAPDSWPAIAYGRAWALADADDSEMRLAATIEVAARTGRTLEEARTRTLRGEILRRARRRVDARTELRAALAGFELIGARGWAGRVARELEATNEVLHRDGRDSPLTRRQLQIAELVAEGASNQEIAARLGMSRKTVEHHLHNAYGALGVRSRRELVDALDLPTTADSA
jgi:DNA-binding CsgD family transcriptional regulator